MRLAAGKLLIPAGKSFVASLVQTFGTLRNYDGDGDADGDGDGNVKNAIGSKSKTTITLFCTFLCCPCITRTRVDQISSLLGNGNGKAINSTISVRTRARSLLFSSNPIPFF